MAVKVVQGLVGKPEFESKSIQNTQAQAGASKAAATPSTPQQGIATAIKSTDAVVSTLRSLRTQGKSSEPIKDAGEAQKLASEVSEKIREDKDGEATDSHGGLSNKSAPVLVN